MKDYIDILEKAIELYIGLPVLTRIKQNPETALDLYQEKINATMLTMDIRSFTRLSKEIINDNLLQYLNLYFKEMSKIIIRNKGYIDSFMGDAIFAVYGISDKNHADNACKTAIECLNNIDILNKKMKSKLKLDIGIGINSGTVMLCNVGSYYKLKFTVMGDMVNMAFRMEGLTLKYKCNIILSEYTKKLLANKYKINELDNVIVKGIDERLKIYSLQS